MSDPRITAAAITSAIAAASIVRALVPTRRPLEARLRPYLEVSRARLGTTQPEAVPGATGVWAPLITAAANALASVIDAGPANSTERRLRHAGFHALGIDGHRRRQLGYTFGAIAAGAAAGVAIRLTPGAVLTLALAAGLWGATRWRARIDKAIARRRETMRAELGTVCQLLAIYLRTGDTPSGSLDRLATRASGLIPSELADASSLVRSGSPAATVFDHLASDTAEPSAARLYRLYGSTWSVGGDPDALLALAEDLRATRREDLTRSMAKRRTAMVLPLVLIIGPILILFVAAAIPSMVFGR